MREQMQHRAAAVLGMLLWAGLTPHAVVARSKAKPKPSTREAPLSLPTAQVGMPYRYIIALAAKIPSGRAVVKMAEGRTWPQWLRFDPAQFELSGLPDQAAKNPYDLQLTISDSAGVLSDQSIHLRLQVCSGPIIVSVSGTKCSAVQAPSDPQQAVVPPIQPSPLAPTSGMTPAQTPGRSPYAPALRITAQIVEGAPSISGAIENIPAGVPWVVEVWRRGDREPFYQAQLNLKDKEGNAYTGRQQPVDDKEPTFTASVTTPLAAGESVRVIAVAPGGSGATLLSKGSPLVFETSLPAEIPRPQIFVNGELGAAATTIGGVLRPLPTIPVQAKAADPAHNLPATPGNLPLIAVEVKDPAAGISHVAIQTSLTETTMAQQVNPDGSFNLHLAIALAAGQTVRLVPVAPLNHHFAGPGRANPWQGRIPGPLFPPPFLRPGRGDGFREIDGPVQKALPVYTNLALSEPVITSQLADNTTTITGTATPSAAGGTSVNVAVFLLTPGETASTEYLTGDSCPTSDGLERPGLRRVGSYQLLTASSATAKTSATSSTSTFSLTLAAPLLQGEKIRIVQVLPAGTLLQRGQLSRCISTVYEVPSLANWGRVHADFTAGLVISNTSTGTSGGDFSEAHQFLALTVDKTWLLPPCYLRRSESDDSRRKKTRREPCYNTNLQRYRSIHGYRYLLPGVNSYFESRLTAIPVSAMSATSTSSTYTLSSSELVSAQTARVDVGTYFPFLITRWDYHRQPNALFLAPLAKAGFDSVVGSSNQTVLLPNNTQGTLNLENLYNFYGFGGRIGHYQMTRSASRAPETYSYLDIILGPFSNLQSDICHRSLVPSSAPTSPLPGYPTPYTLPGSSCTTDYPQYYRPSLTAYPYSGWVPVDSRKRIYRLDIEGLLKIPSTPLYVGFNTNLAQRSLGAAHLDHGYAAPDDLRFFFGTRFDLGAAMARLGIVPF